MRLYVDAVSINSFKNKIDDIIISMVGDLNKLLAFFPVSAAYIL